MFDEKYMNEFINGVEQKCKRRAEKKARMTKRTVALCVALVITVTAVGIGFRPKEPPIDSVIESSEEDSVDEPVSGNSAADITSEDKAMQNIIYGNTYIEDLKINTDFITNVGNRKPEICGKVSIDFDYSDNQNDLYHVIMIIPNDFYPFTEVDVYYKKRLEKIEAYCLNNSDDFSLDAINELKDGGIEEEWIKKYGKKIWQINGGHECNGVTDAEPCFKLFYENYGYHILEDKNYKLFENYDNDNLFLHYMSHFENAFFEFKELGIEAKHRGYGYYTAYLTKNDIEILKTGYYSLDIKCLNKEYTDIEWNKWREEMNILIDNTNGKIIPS